MLQKQVVSLELIQLEEFTTEEFGVPRRARRKRKIDMVRY